MSRVYVNPGVGSIPMPTGNRFASMPAPDFTEEDAALDFGETIKRVKANDIQLNAVVCHEVLPLSLVCEARSTLFDPINSGRVF